MDCTGSDEWVNLFEKISDVKRLRRWSDSMEWFNMALSSVLRCFISAFKSRFSCNKEFRSEHGGVDGKAKEVFVGTAEGVL